MMQMMGMNRGNKDGRKETFMIRSSNMTQKLEWAASKHQWSSIVLRDMTPHFLWEITVFRCFQQWVFQHQTRFTSFAASSRLQWVFDRRAFGCLGRGSRQTLHLGFGWKELTEVGENGQPMWVKTQGRKLWICVGRWGEGIRSGSHPEDGWKMVMVEARLSSFHVAKRMSKDPDINSIFFGGESFWLVSLLVKIQQRLVAQTKGQRSWILMLLMDQVLLELTSNGRYPTHFMKH